MKFSVYHLVRMTSLSCACLL